MYRPRRKLLLAAMCAALPVAAACASAQAAPQENTWPAKPVRLIVPFPPGGGADSLGRIVAQQLTERLGLSFIIENRTGAGGLIGWQSVARAEPDGYTFLIAGISLAVTMPITQGQEYDPKKDLKHVALLGGPPTVLIVNGNHPARTVAELIATIKKSPDGLSWGSPGPGTHGSLIGDAFGRETGTHMVHVAYRGGGPAVADVAANHLPAAFMTLSGATAQIQAGRVRALAVTSSKRTTEFPDVPTFEELGYPKLTGAPWFALSGPPTLPASIADRLNKEVQSILQTPEAKAELGRQTMEVVYWDVPTVNAFVQKEAAYWSPYTKDMLEKAK
jgi:tripartite-type tricarboxylate transporter receptor subunit TctC